MATGTVRLHRVLRAKPERVYRAFLDAEAMAKWLPPYGFTCKVHHMDARVGGTYRMSFTNFSTGNGHSFGGEYLELIPNERIRTPTGSTIRTCPARCTRPSPCKQVSCGTDLNIVQEGIPEVIPGRDVLPRLAGIARRSSPSSSSPRFPTDRGPDAHSGGEPEHH